MDIIQLSLFKLAKKEKISIIEFRVLNNLHKKQQDFLELSENTGAEMAEIKEIISKFKKNKFLKEFNGKYSIDAMQVLNSLITEVETIKEFVE